MSTEIRIPQLGASMQEGTLVEWVIEDGASVDKGQVLYLLETDKTTQEIEAPVAGTVKIIVPAGEEHPVGTLIGEIDAGC
jgi:pyruvate/2-oxoglutarate dehydrogenase complex dihydrolipoamide acyltransferase (E2) component